MISVMNTAGSLALSKPILIAGVAGGLSIILTVGLISGLVARPNNCIKPEIDPTTLSVLTSTTSLLTQPPATTLSTLPSSTSRPTTSSSSTSSSTRPVPQTTTSTRPQVTTTTTPPTSTTRQTSSSTSTRTATTSASTPTSTTSASTPTSSTQRTTSTSSSTSTTSSSTTRTTTTPSTQSSSSTTRTTTTSSTQSSSSTTRTTTTSSTQSSSSTTRGSTTPFTQSSKSTILTLPTLSTLSSTTKPQTTLPPPPVRLPTNLFEPINYDLKIKAYFKPYGPVEADKERFEGTVKIKVKVNNQTDRIVLHADYTLKISETITLQNLANDQMTTIVNFEFTPNQLLVINLANPIQPGNYTLKIDYQSDFGLPGNLVGFYRSRYLEDGIQKTIVATDFEPIDARRAFPSFDEPALKATYDITVIHPSDSIALSNWPAIETVNDEDGFKKTTFSTTPPMSTYLACWVIAPDDFGYATETTEKGVPIRIFARKSAVEKGLVNFAASVAKSATDYFENVYFKISEAVPPKIDMIALPEFSSGAMENWGLVTYRETALLYSDEFNSAANKQRVAEVVAHELAHFWFGDLVTCSWWNDLWLNEAMATFLENKALNYIFPEWDILTQFISQTMIPVMYDDGYEASHPVIADIKNPNEIASLFDSITYDKGCSLLFMLESTVTEAVFQNGLVTYLQTNKYGSGNASDFYNTLTLPQEMKNVTAQEYIENWLLQINYPELAVLLVNDSQSSNSKVIFEQERFTLSVYNEEDFFEPIISPFNYTWKIYVQCVAGGDGANNLLSPIDKFNFYLDKPYDELKLNKKYSWVKCNKDFKSFYVTDYTKDNYEKLISILRTNPDTFTTADRANLIHVSYSLSFRGTQNYETAAYLSSYLEAQENDYVPWKVFFWHMNKIAQVLEHRVSFASLKNYGISLVNLLSDRIDLWTEGTEHIEKLFKTSVIEFRCRLQDLDCLKNMTNYFNQIPSEYFQDPNNDNITAGISADIRQSVYRYHIQNTNEFLDWFSLFSLYTSTYDPQEASFALSGLTYSRLFWVLEEYLYQLLSDNKLVKSQDVLNIITLIGRNPNGRHQAWAWVRDNWGMLVSIYGNGRGVNRVIKSICESFDNVFLAEEVLNFYSKIPIGGGYLLRRQTIDIIFNNIFWVNDREKEIISALFVPSTQKNTK